MTKKIFSILFLMISCTSIGYKLRLQDKTLLIRKEFPGKLIFPTFITKCKYPDRRFFRGCEKVHVIEEYDLNDEEVISILEGANFECNSTSRFKY